MRKMFLRSFAAVMAVCMLVLSVSGFIVSEVDDESYTEIIVCCSVDSDKVQLITDTISGETSDFQGIAPFSIFCLFGHSIATTTVREISHRHYSSSPRCLESRYRVEYCTRSSCNYSVATLTATARIICCS